MPIDKHDSILVSVILVLGMALTVSVIFLKEIKEWHAVKRTTRDK